MTTERTAVRREDAFDVSAVAGWLGDEVGITGTPSVEQYRGGASNLTYLLGYPDGSLILRRPPTGAKARGAHDMVREYTVQHRLKPAFSYVPEMIALCTDENVIGSQFYVMERVPGVIPRANLPEGYMLSRDDAGELASVFVDRFVDLHRVDPDEVGLSELGRGDGYVARQLRGWTDRYRNALTPGAPDFGAITSWLERLQPPDVDSCVIHNDFRFDNLVLDESLTKVRAVLDWEMSTVGDPLMDVACALAYWVQADDPPGMLALRKQPTHLPGMPTRADVFEYYCLRMDLSPDAWPFYEVFGTFRLAVILQQIYYRYHLGQTSNPDFAGFGATVEYLHGRCHEILSHA
ncbi:phosphotransferase family protein [Solicola gregarius]|uniref:Phosphotransferase family protein n=1 Tax=Solicola gregarius TaxID=2908642 RepID=A0AA46TLK7_9ACTN|nr:phosphotransferase family protein [Solicola gregarius]UYM07174.1 phosphotransferase family protein [Solicola gregarius]